MTITQQQFKESILTIADYFDKKDVYHNIILMINMQSAVKALIHLMFIKQLNRNSFHMNQNPELATAYDAILEYTEELEFSGIVNFKP